MIIVTATTSITSATVTPTNQGWDRRMIKPVSAAITNAAAINSAIRPNPCDVIIALTAQSNGVTPVGKRKAVRQDEAACTSIIVCV
jgi:hypothetical protein